MPAIALPQHLTVRRLLRAGLFVFLFVPILLVMLNTTPTDALAGGTIPPPVPVTYWTSSAIDPNAIKDRTFDVAVDDAGNLHVVYVATHNGHEALMYAVGKPGAWTISVVAMAVENEEQEDLPILMAQIALDDSGTPHILYWNWYDGIGSDKLRYAYLDGDTWVNTLVTGASVGNIVPLLFDMAMTIDNEPIFITLLVPDGGNSAEDIVLTSFVLQDAWTEKLIGGEYIGAMRVADEADGAPCVFIATNQYGIGNSLLHRACYRNDAWSTLSLQGNVQTYDYAVLYDSDGFLSLMDSGPIYGDNPRQAVVVQQEGVGGLEAQLIYRGDDPADAGNFARAGSGALAGTWAMRSNVAPYPTNLFFALRDGSAWQSERVLVIPIGEWHLNTLAYSGEQPYIVWISSRSVGLQIAQRNTLLPESVMPLPVVQMAQ